MSLSDLDQVAASFVTQYYEGLLLQPKSLAACYGPDSTMCVAHADGTSTEAQGQEQVGPQIAALCDGLPQNRKLQVIDAQIFPSFENSSLIIVDGVVLSEGWRQEFTHTVVLRNNGVEGEFYIRNDVWRFAAPVSTNAPVQPAAAAVEQEQEAETVEAEAEEDAAEEESAASAEAEEEREAEEEVEEETQEEETPAESPATSPSKKQEDSATPSEADETPAKAPAKTEAPAKPTGPINWASKARATPSTDAKAAAPQRVSPPPRVVADSKQTKKVEEKPAAAKKTSEEAPRRRDGQGPRDQAKSLLVIKVRDVEDEDVKAGLPPALRSGIVSLRNKSSEGGRVFLDFVQANALELLKDPSLRIAGKSFSVEPQKKR